MMSSVGKQKQLLLLLLLLLTSTLCQVPRNGFIDVFFNLNLIILDFSWIVGTIRQLSLLLLLLLLALLRLLLLLLTSRCFN